MKLNIFFNKQNFTQLKAFSYNCITTSLNHLNVTCWNEILHPYLPTIENLEFFIQIPCNSSNTIEDIEQILNDLQNKFSYSSSFSFSKTPYYYLIYMNEYPKKYFCLTELNEDCHFGFTSFSKINSLFIDSQSMSSCSILPKTIEHLQIQNTKNDFYLEQYLKNCSKQLISLKIIGLPDDLPSLPNLRRLTIQQVMLNLTLATKLSTLCPRLELLTCEIDCIKQFGEILHQLRYQSNLTELKFLRIFSRDTNQTWSSWLDETNEFVNNTKYEVRNLFLFIWL